jgi:hypothetical protein
MTTTLDNASDVEIGVEKDFTVTVDDGDQGDVMVLGQFTFTNYAPEDIVLKYMAPGATEYTTLTISDEGVATFGPAEGFALSDATHDFKIQFNKEKVYSFSTSLINVADETVVASAAGSVTAGDIAEPTIDGTLDVISDVVFEQDILWQVFVRPNARVGEKVNLEIKLENPAQRNNFKLHYNSNREAQTEEEATYSEVVFDEEGLATVGPEEGEAMLAEYKEYFKINFSAPGTYRYQLVLRRMDGNTLVSVNEVVRVATVAGLDDMIGDKRVVVYPTVSEGSVQVDLGNIRNASVTVVDMLGRKVLQLEKVNGKAEINTKKFSRGTYFVKVYAGKDVATSRLIVR